MIGADGAGADKFHRAARKHVTGHLGDRAHQQYIGVGDGGAVDTAPRQAAYVARPLKELGQQGDIFVGNDQHGRLLWRSRSLGVREVCSEILWQQ